MKKILTTIIMAGIFSCASVSAFETNQFKYIPKEAYVISYDVNNNGLPDFYWYDKNKDNSMQANEIFIDLNEDGIPDISYEEVFEMYLQNERFRTMHV